MAEYYPLLAKAVGSLPNSTTDTRRVVYERARKALIGQLRMLHPPVPDEDIERESVELDRAVERLESELASGRLPSPPPAPASLPAATPSAVAGSLAPGAPATPPLRPPKPDATKPDAIKSTSLTPARPASVMPEAASPRASAPPRAGDGRPVVGGAEIGRAAAFDDTATIGDSPLRTAPADGISRPRADGQRPIAPQPRASEGPRRRIWIIPVGIGLIVVAAVALAAFELRDPRSGVVRVKPSDQTAGADGGKIAERVGGPGATAGGAPARGDAKGSDVASRSNTAASTNPEVPVAQRAALLIEAPDEPNKVKTFLGTVVWKINNAGTGDVTSVEADIDLPDDRMKAVVTFEKNTDASLPASHTIKVRFTMQPGTLSGDVQQISVPQLRQEDSPSGEALAGVTVPVVQNSFLVGLSPGNAETVNLKQLKEMQWIDVPMLLQSGKIAKLTFEKGSAGERDLDEAIAAWQKS